MVDGINGLTQTSKDMTSPFLSLSIATQRGAIKGWRGFGWMLKIILPVSLATFLLDFSGWLHLIDGILEPLMGALHLPAMAALPLKKTNDGITLMLALIFRGQNV